MVGFIACVALVFSILCFYKIHTLKKDKAKEDRGKSRETEDVPDILDRSAAAYRNIFKQFSNPVEQHNAYRFRKVTDGECRQRCHAH